MLKLVIKLFLRKIKKYLSFAKKFIAPKLYLFKDDLNPKTLVPEFYGNISTPPQNC